MIRITTIALALVLASAAVAATTNKSKGTDGSSASHCGAVYCDNAH